MKIYIRDRNESIIGWFQKLQNEFKIPDLYLRLGSPWDEPVDAMVSPANSFGFMDGGIDWHYTNLLGQKVQDNIQKVLSFSGKQEILVGEAKSFPTYNEKYPNLIVAPTMRVPKPIDDPIDVMLATRAAVQCGILFNYKDIAMPGMGTGAGNVSHDIAARAMLVGIQSALNPYPFPKSWREAYDRHVQLKG